MIFPPFVWLFMVFYDLSDRPCLWTWQQLMQLTDPYEGEINQAEPIICMN